MKGGSLREEEEEEEEEAKGKKEWLGYDDASSCKLHVDEDLNNYQC